MHDIVEEVLLLQTAWTSTLTPEMDRRGQLVRRDGASWLRDRLDEITIAVGKPIDDMSVQGRDGTGPKSELPWLRLYSSSRSPSATVGWYVVYLFEAEGNVAYLSLNQGTTTWTGTEYQSRPMDELGRRVQWARDRLGSRLSSPQRATLDIQLHARRTHLGAQYEAGNVVAIPYLLDDVPDNQVLHRDVLLMAQLLGELYRGEETTLVPGDPVPEVAEIVDAANRVAGRRNRPSRSRTQITAVERKLIENHAVSMATQYYEQDGWVVKDVGSTPVSYDLHLERGDEVRHVEVKGTTSAGEQVVLTRNEVDKQRLLSPANALVVVRNIILDRNTNPPTASGGNLNEVTPWEIDEDDLTVVAYVYATGLT